MAGQRQEAPDGKRMVKSRMPLARVAGYIMQQYAINAFCLGSTVRCK